MLLSGMIMNTKIHKTCQFSLYSLKEQEIFIHKAFGVLGLSIIVV